MIRWIEGFEGDKDATSLARKYPGSTLTGLATSSGETNGTALHAGSTSQLILLTPSFGNEQTWSVGLRHRALAELSIYDRRVVALMDGSTIQLSLWDRRSLSDPSNYHFYTLESNGIVFAATPDIPNATWRYLEVLAHIHPTLGSIEFRIDGLVFFSGTSLPVSANGSQQASQVRFSGSESFFDDIYIGDEVLGEISVEGASPKSDGPSSEWSTLGGGAHYVEVDEATPDDDTSFLHNDADNLRDVFSHDEFAFSGAKVLAVQQNIQARLAAAGSRQVHGVVRVDGETFEDPGTTVDSTSWKHAHSIWENNPKTGSPWELEDVVRAHFGVGS
ncbi:MAG: hypothetical protein ACF8XB_21535 [Planctomycetota bacterium JB042]